ncbi:hypothetical protein HK099_000056 [Clydaea vesicula]|uniref:Histone deacetylation protein Rxt3 n=1 Tax=Clydaea vesicula TaxID=447962 RepID=A0AAD5UBK3_9FUNG|nr:hypothetical protein HK099_000056 [Clydaea vesicula]KAJ3389831.1 hypothetical protein HDU92_000853 [Lobulomyces angularis]
MNSSQPKNNLPPLVGNTSNANVSLPSFSRISQSFSQQRVGEFPDYYKNRGSISSPSTSRSSPFASTSQFSYNSNFQQEKEVNVIPKSSSTGSLATFNLPGIQSLKYAYPTSSEITHVRSKSLSNESQNEPNSYLSSSFQQQSSEEVQFGKENNILSNQLESAVNEEINNINSNISVKASTKRKREGLELSSGLTRTDEKKIEFEKLKEEARRKKYLGEVPVINDECLTKIPEETLTVESSKFKNKTLRKTIGPIIYTGAKVRIPFSTKPSDLELFLLPIFTRKDFYSTVEIKIPAELLLFSTNVALRVCAVWGTDVYSDDSDIVAAIVHSGFYRPADVENPFKLLTEPFNQPVKQTVIGEIDSTDNLPDHDLLVVIMVLPRLVKYTGSIQYGMKSRGWGEHNGESFKIQNVSKIKKGLAKNK